ncbi:MAG: cupredoxin domain-containing protein [Anaerolineae bacterium]
MGNAKIGSHVFAAIGGGVIGAIWLSAIWAVIVFPPQIELGGGAVLRGDSITLVLHEWGFNELNRGGPSIEIRAGTEITITLVNEGRNFHTFQIVQDDGEKVAGLDEDQVIGSGETLVITFTIYEPGEYFYICPVSGHRDKGMIGIVTVLP